MKKEKILLILRYVFLLIIFAITVFHLTESKALEPNFENQDESPSFDNEAQKDIGFESYRMKNKNAFSISILDSALLYSVNYDRIVLDWLGFGIGGAYIGTAHERFGAQVHLYSNLYPFRGESFALLVSPGVSLTTNEFDIADFTGEHAYGVVGVGFEFRKALMIRVKLNMIFSTEDFFFPWPGIAIGGSF